jgi:hypothetical protein
MPKNRKIKGFLYGFHVSQAWSGRAKKSRGDVAMNISPAKRQVNQSVRFPFYIMCMQKFM